MSADTSTPWAPSQRGRDPTYASRPAPSARRRRQERQSPSVPPHGVAPARRARARRKSADTSEMVQYERPGRVPAGRGRRGCRGRTGTVRPGRETASGRRLHAGRNRLSAKTMLRPRLFQQVRSPRATTRPIPGRLAVPYADLGRGVDLDDVRGRSTGPAGHSSPSMSAVARSGVVPFIHGTPEGHARGWGRKSRRLTRSL